MSKVEPGVERYFARELAKIKKAAPVGFLAHLDALMRAAVRPWYGLNSCQFWNAYSDYPDWTIEAMRLFRAKRNRDEPGYWLLCRGNTLDETDAEIADSTWSEYSDTMKDGKRFISWERKTRGGLSAAAVKKARLRLGTKKRKVSRS